MWSTGYQDEKFTEMLKAPYVSSDAMLMLIKKYQNCKNPTAKDAIRETIFNNNIRFIRKVAIYHSRKKVSDVEDIFGSCVIAFFEGLERFKLDKNVKFSTYIKFWLDKGAYDCMHSSSILKIPRNDYSQKKEQVSKALNNNLTYIDATAKNEDGDDFKGILIADDRAINPEHDYVINKNSEIIYKIINKSLTPRERTVIRGCFFEDKSDDEIGKEIGLSHSRVQQLRHLAISKIKEAVSNSKKNEVYKLRKKRPLSDKRRKECIEVLKRINSDPEMIRRRALSRRGYILSPAQKAKISEAKKNPSEEDRLKRSKTMAKLPIDIARRAKKLLLSGKSQAQTAKELGVSSATVYKIYKHKLLYVRDAGVIFTESDVAKIKKLEDINRFKNGIESNKKKKLKKEQK